MVANYFIKTIYQNLRKKKGQPLILSQAGLNDWLAREPQRLQTKNFEELLGQRVLRGLMVAPSIDEFSAVIRHA